MLASVQEVAMIRNSAMMYRCFTCGGEFQFGPHIYNGKHIAAYNLTVCLSCYDGNWDGWAPHCEAKILAHLKDNDLKAPARNEGGYLPRHPNLG